MQLVRDRIHRTIVGVALCALLTAVLYIGAAAAWARVPTTPRAIAPAGIAVQTKPSFYWSKSYRSKTMEVRIYKGTTLILRKTGITTRPWRCGKNLPAFVGLRWKVRGLNGSGSGRWSNIVRFRIEPIYPALVHQWWGGGTAPWCQLIMNSDGTFTRWLDAPFAGANGMFSREGRWAVSGQAIRVTHLTETWEPTPMDQSGIAGYTDQPLPNCQWTYTLAADGLTLDIVDGVTISFWRDAY